jgi:hypothetical protein
VPAIVPRRRKHLNFWHFVSFPIEPLFSSAHYCEHLLGLEVDFPDRVVLGVAQIQVVHLVPIDVTHALRVVELSLLVVSINQAYLARAYNVNTLHGILVYHN